MFSTRECVTIGRNSHEMPCWSRTGDFKCWGDWLEQMCSLPRLHGQDARNSALDDVQCTNDTCMLCRASGNFHVSLLRSNLSILVIRGCLLRIRVCAVCVYVPRAMCP